MIARFRGALALAVAAGAALPAAASAHAVLENTQPHAGARLAQSPAMVVVRFDEAVTAAPGAVKVFDAGGRRREIGRAFHPGGRGADVGVRLPRRLPAGGYTATYRVISDDSHTVSGGLTFTIGQGGAAALGVAGVVSAQRPGPVTRAAFSAARAVQYAAIALAVGTLIFVFACWLPALRAVAGGSAAWRRASVAFATRVRGLLWGAAVAGVMSGLAAILLEAAEAQGESFWAAAQSSPPGDVLDTRFGVAWLAAIAVWTAVGAGLAVRRPTVPVLCPASVGATGLALPAAGRRALLLVAPAAVLVFLPALAGHASVQSPVALLLPADVLHVAAMATWLGGIALLVLALRAATAQLGDAEGTRLAVGVIGRFSALALGAFAVLAATGAAMAVAQVSSVAALSATAYGRAVLVKVVLFGVLVALGYANRGRLLPALSGTGGPRDAGRLLGHTLRAELGVGIVVLAVTGVLAGSAPRSSAATSVGAAAPHVQPTVTRSATLGPARLRATLEGAERLRLDLVDRRSGAPFMRAAAVDVQAALPGEGFASPVISARAAGDGRWVARPRLGVRGTWQITVTVRTTDLYEYTTRLSVPMH